MPKVDFSKNMPKKEQEIPLRDQPIFKEIQDFFRDNSKTWYAPTYIKNHFKITQKETKAIIKTLYDQSELRRKEELKDIKIITLYKWYSEVNEPHDMPLSPEARKTLEKRIKAKKTEPLKDFQDTILDLAQEITNLKKKIEALEQENEDLPDEVYKALWIMCRSFRSQYRNKGDGMLGQLSVVINHFNVDLSKNPFEELKKKGSE